MGFEPQIRKIVDQIRVCIVLVELNNSNVLFFKKNVTIFTISFCSRTDRLSCGALRGPKRWGSWLRTSWRTMYRSTSVLCSSVPTTTSYRLSTFATMAKKKTSECWGLWKFSFVCCVMERMTTNLLFFFRLMRLLEEIMSEKENKTIIFVETKKRCDDLTRRMRRDGWDDLLCFAVSWLLRLGLKWREFIGFSFCRWPAMGIHGDKSQQERDWVLNGMCSPWRSWIIDAVLVDLHDLTLSLSYLNRVQIRQSAHPHCHRCCFQRTRLVILSLSVLYHFILCLLYYTVLPFPFNCCAFLSPSHLKVESWRQDLGMTRPGSPGGGKELLCGVLLVCQPIKLHSEAFGALWLGCNPRGGIPRRSVAPLSGCTCVLLSSALAQQLELLNF